MLALTYVIIDGSVGTEPYARAQTHARTRNTTFNDSLFKDAPDCTLKIKCAQKQTTIRNSKIKIILKVKTNTHITA